MRVTQMEINRNLFNDLEKLNRTFADVNRQLTSTKKLNSLSDSPLGSAYLVDITEQALRLDAYRFNITNSAYQLRSAEAALNAVNNVFVSIHTLGMQAANETLSTDSRKAILKEIEILRDELISRGNSQVDGRFIFAGTAVGDKPFDEDPPGSGMVKYVGNNEDHLVPIGDGVEVVAGVSGEKALGAVFKVVNELIDAMKTAIANENASGIGESLAGYGDALTQLGQSRGQVGVSLSVVDRMSEMIGARNIVLREQKSNIEDANILEVATRLGELQLALNAAMSAGSVILGQRNLFDAIG